MRKQFILAIMCIFDIFPEERNIIEEVNIYGGRTIERIFDENEKTALNYSKLIQYYDSRDSIVKNVFEHTKERADSTGIIVQINYYRNNIIEKYEMFLTDSFQSLYGFNRLIEEVNEEDVITKRIWYINDAIIDVSESAEDGFSFYNIEFIYDDFFRDYQPNENGDVISISGKYFRIKSVIKFDTVLFELDNNDITLMDSFSNSLRIDNIGQYYSKKVRVYSENRSYWLYVQTQLEQYVLGQDATIRYYPIGLNRELYLICVGFYDIRK
jgi:hypothetical protein